MDDNHQLKYNKIHPKENISIALVNRLPDVAELDTLPLVAPLPLPLLLLLEWIDDIESGDISHKSWFNNNSGALNLMSPEQHFV